MNARPLMIVGLLAALVGVVGASLVLIPQPSWTFYTPYSIRVVGQDRAEVGLMLVVLARFVSVAALWGWAAARDGWTPWLVSRGAAAAAVVYTLDLYQAPRADLVIFVVLAAFHAWGVVREPSAPSKRIPLAWLLVPVWLALAAAPLWDALAPRVIAAVVTTALIVFVRFIEPESAWLDAALGMALASVALMAFHPTWYFHWTWALLPLTIALVGPAFAPRGWLVSAGALAIAVYVATRPGFVMGL